MLKYVNQYYVNGRYSAEEKFNTLKECRSNAKDFINDLRETCTSAKGYIKIGNLAKDNQQTIDHKAFGFEAGVYIKKIKYSSYNGIEYVQV